MSDLKDYLSTQPKKQKLIGIFVMLGSMAGFFASMSYFGLFGGMIEYKGTALAKEVIASGFVILGMYGLGYAFGAKRAGFALAKWWTILMIGAGSLGYLIRQFR